MKTELLALRACMKKKGVDYYLIPTDDFHSSEYVGSYFKCREYISGFTGSAGTLLVSENWAGLWTDGRYFIQAAQQLENSGITLCKMGEPGVPTIEGYLKQNLEKDMVLGFDGRCVNTNTFKKLKNITEENNAQICCEMDLVGDVWDSRPALSAKPVFELPLNLTGQCREEKIKNVREEMKKEQADTLILSSLEDICWLLNIRGGDVDCNPVVLSFAAITQEKFVLFINETVLSQEIRKNLESAGISFQPYNAVYEYVKNLQAGSSVMMNLGVVNSAIYASVPENVMLIDHVDPTELPKAIKNDVEVENFRIAHIRDGVAVTKFMYWLKQNIGKTEMTEISAAEKLESFREIQENYLGPSFEPIVSWGYHGAIVHYSATEETDIPIQPSSFMLADTGGHYLEGTTDITRTFALGEMTEEEKEFYTLVLKGHLNLAAANFRYGCTGLNLDYLAREPFWARNMDYNHGTGHGVGYLLNVHEGPQGFRWRSVGKNEAAVLEPGMITSNEPGIYLEGKFGIRLENLIVCVEGETTSYGRFLHFEDLTMVPFDLDAINTQMLTEREKMLLNCYHKKVYDTLAAHMTQEEAEWLKEATRMVD